MSEDSTEEKKHDASQKKLTDMRKKGQVPTAKEAVQSLSTVAILAFAMLTLISAGNNLGTLFRADFYHIDGPFMVVFKHRFIEVIQVTLSVSFGALALAAITGVAANLMISGFVFSAESMKLDFNKLNPVKGAEKIVGIQGIKTFSMNMMRLIALVVAGGGTAYLLYPNVLATLSCGFSCGNTAVANVLVYSLLAMMVVMLFMAILDYIVSTQEFLRQQKMTDTERKQEQKDMMGSPELRGLRQELRNDIATKTIGGQYATFIIDNGHGKAVAIHFEQGVTDWPILVAKTGNLDALRRMHRLSGAPVVTDATASEILRRVPIGDEIYKDEHVQLLLSYVQKYG